MASKRSAMDDDARLAAAPSTQAKKRPALASLSNSCNVPVVRPAMAAAAAQIVGKAKALCAGDENAPSLMHREAQQLLQIDETFESPAAKANPAAVASLERKTVQSLYISSSRSSETLLKSFKDIDLENKDPQMCGVYATEIYHHLRIRELKRRPTTNFMEVVQRDINASMRGILVDWLVEVAEEYKLVPDTLYLTVSYIDRYLSANVVNRQRLQLLGVSCMLIAAKYEEICAPQVEEFCYITDNTYSKEEVLIMERQVLNNLRFELTTPTIKTFLRRFMRAAQASYHTPSLQLEFLGNFLAELSLVEYTFLKYKPSMIAASAVFLAKLTVDPTEDPWNGTLRHYTGYCASELAQCVRDIHELQCNTKGCGLPAVREKYKQHKFKCVATLAAPSPIAAEKFEDEV
ncbi:hypothetical protein SELMODRAFT_412894 [Selaginella moellendorffii]|uniref:Uncharacterized protein CYCA1-1 n=1 Tax=Selaginella moellendorffii TaxID=88036 RepID=D8RMN9_SELML|nr:cyclin-A1-4 [Selaginella moellendorffii]EFJ26373.1 hypothetical protein SELMODRAFT_412894 [Selaginella moellendorffii]|eukprot:XP_002972287.1 cyclin-A1-4 [Selaginella moellendorffii]